MTSPAIPLLTRRPASRLTDEEDEEDDGPGTAGLLGPLADEDEEDADYDVEGGLAQVGWYVCVCEWKQPIRCMKSLSTQATRPIHFIQCVASPSTRRP